IPGGLHQGNTELAARPRHSGGAVATPVARQLRQPPTEPRAPTYAPAGRPHHATQCTKRGAIMTRRSQPELPRTFARRGMWFRFLLLSGLFLLTAVLVRGHSSVFAAPADL